MAHLLTTAQVARMHGKSVRTIHRMIHSGELRYEMKVGEATGAYLFHPAEVERAFAAKAAA